MRTTKIKRKAFTLVEMLIVMLVVAILVGIGLFAYDKAIKKAEKAACLSNRREIKRISDIYLMEHADKTLVDISLSDSNSGIIKYVDKIAKCPSNGTYELKLDPKGYIYVQCSFHDLGQDGGENTPDFVPAYDQNYNYENALEYEEGKTYKYGDIVLKDGVYYRCLNSNKSSNSAYAPGNRQDIYNPTWGVIGGKDGEAVPYVSGQYYIPGTIVEYNGQKYMFTPELNDSRYSYLDPSNKTHWTPATDELQKPPKTEENYNAKEYTSGTSFNKGEYCSINGKLYESGINNNNSSPSDYNAIKNGSWKAVATTYSYENAKYSTGDRVWYKGQYYIALKGFTTYSANYQMTPNYTNSKYWKLES
ncbi:MAG: prepilin-type N-terminal cleavage/methylation domain-containing protein [Synergistaceae bacterium]